MARTKTSRTKKSGSSKKNSDRLPYRQIVDFHDIVRLTAHEREGILRAIKRKADDFDVELFLSRLEFAASAFLSHHVPTNQSLLPVEHKLRTETPAVVRERLEKLRDAISEAGKRLRLLDDTSRRLLTKEVRNSAVGEILYNTFLNPELDQAAGQERTFTVEDEEIRTQLLETMVEQALVEASKTKGREGRSQNIPLVTLAFEVSVGLASLGIESTPSSNGAFGITLQLVHNAAYRTAADHRNAEKALTQDEMDKRDVRWSKVRLPKDAPGDHNQLKRLLLAIRKK